MRDLLAAIVTALDAGRACVVCTLVETRGSTPQKAGAGMLVFADGGQVGTLGGGCVEAEVKRRALGGLLGGEVAAAELQTFQLDDNYGWDDGLICGGRMTILVDPVTADKGDYFRRYRKIVDEGIGGTEAVAWQGDGALSPGCRVLFGAKGEVVGRTGEARDPGEIARHLVPLERRPRPYQKEGVAYLPVLPRIHLLIVGGGHVGLAVAKASVDVDFNVWIVDDRDAYASADRFPMAARRYVGDIGQTLARLAPELDANVYALIVTRGHAHDEEALYHLANTRCGYVGLIGSKRKIKLIYDDLLAKGISAETLRRVHAPLGLDIGSQTVNEIAVSILAELIAVRNRGATIRAARIDVSV